MPVVWSTHDLATVESVEKRMANTVLALKTDQRALIEDTITRKHDFIKELIENHILDWLRKTRANTVNEWTKKAIAQVKEARGISSQKYDLSGSNTVAPEPGESLTTVNGDDFSTTLEGMNPQTFYLASTPVNGASGSFANTARNGSRLVDTQNSLLYINRGTLAVPSWQRFRTGDLINYITNIDKLTTPASTGIVWQIFEEGAGGISVDDPERIEKLTDRWEKMFHSEIKLAVSLLDIDESGDGLISDYEDSVGRESEGWIF